jgi:hypothetical protein
MTPENLKNDPLKFWPGPRVNDPWLSEPSGTPESITLKSLHFNISCKYLDIYVHIFD